MYISRLDISDLYLEMITEGLEEKIPHLVGLVNPNVENKPAYIKWVADNFDPSPNSMYISWILKMLRQGILRGEEDASKVKESLETFTALKNKPQFPSMYKDINRFKSWGDLAEVLGKFSDVKSKKEQVRIAREEGIELVEEIAPYKLYIVTKEEAAAKHFRDTHWCVKDPRHFNNYGPPYYYFTKDDQSFTLLHLNSDQCMDVNDRDTQLNNIQQEMMESEKMTRYVIAHDNTDSAISNYKERIGEGYEGLIDEMIQKQLDEIIARFPLTIFSLDTDNISQGYYSAWGSIPYDFSGLEDNFEDRSFQQLVKSVLHDVDIYVEYLDSENLHDDGVNFTIDYDPQSDYHSHGPVDKLHSFLRELENMEDDWTRTTEKFKEKLDDEFLKAGYISSGWATFKTKVLDNVNWNRQFPHAESNGFYKNIKFDFFPVDDSPDFYKAISNTGPINLNNINVYEDTKLYPILKLISKFFIHTGIISKDSRVNYLTIMLGRSGKLNIQYCSRYAKNMTFDDYMKDIKIFKSFNNNYDNYGDQIRKFYGDYIYPALQHLNKTGELNITGNEKIPVLQVRGRKEPKEQRHLQFREGTVRTFDELYARLF